MASVATTAHVPAVRFKGFEGDWERRNVAELLIERNVKTPKSSEYPLMAFIAYEGVAAKGDRYDRSSLVNDTENKLYKQTELGDFIYSSNNLESGSIGLNNYGKATISPVYSIFQPTQLANSAFIGRRFVKKDFINDMVKWRQGVIYGQWRIHESDFLKIDVIVPKVTEQRIIGQYLENIDTLIALQQQKYEKLQNVKKAMLAQMFPAPGATTPAVRFAGFTNPWQTKKFSDIFTYLQNNSLSRADLNYKNGKVRNVHYGDVLVKFGETLDVSKDEIPYITNKDFVVSGASLLQDGDVVIADAAEDETVGKCSEIIGIRGSAVVSGLHTIPCRPTQKFASGYLGYFMNSTTYHDQLLPIMQGTKVSSISKTALQDTDVFFPNEKDEQFKIGKYFSDFDNLISLQQRKLEKLQCVKKACLEGMFV